MLESNKENLINRKRKNTSKINHTSNLVKTIHSACTNQKCFSARNCEMFTFTLVRTHVHSALVWVQRAAVVSWLLHMSLICYLFLIFAMAKLIYCDDGEHDLWKARSVNKDISGEL